MYLIVAAKVVIKNGQSLNPYSNGTMYLMATSPLL